MPQTQHTRSAPSANESPRRQRGRPVDTVVVFNADLPKPPNIPAKLVKLLNQYCPDVQTWINDLMHDEEKAMFLEIDTPKPPHLRTQAASLHAYGHGRGEAAAAITPPAPSRTRLSTTFWRRYTVG